MRYSSCVVGTYGSMAKFQASDSMGISGPYVLMPILSLKIIFSLDLMTPPLNHPVISPTFAATHFLSAA